MYRLLFTEGNPSGVKAALEAQGICSREVRLPLTPMSDNGKALLAKEIQKLG
jgi:4-hydroxy-tetrahydrodipicolinate synthase